MMEGKTMSKTQTPYRGMIAETVAEIDSPDALQRIYILAVRLYRKEQAEKEHNTTGRAADERQG